MANIEITTTQNVTIEYELADLRERIFAFVIDVLIIVVSFALIMMTMGLMVSPLYSGRNNEVLLKLFVMPLIMFYTLYNEILMNGQTLGKRALGIKVVKLNGDPPAVSDYIMRWATRLIDIWLSLGTVATLLVTSSPKAQRIGCLLSGTVVIRLRSSKAFSLRDILKINSLDNYTPTYPQVTVFNEKDMLFIKGALDRYTRFPNNAHNDVIIDLSAHCASKLGLDQVPTNRVAFLRRLLNDYIVLTR